MFKTAAWPGSFTLAAALLAAGAGLPSAPLQASGGLLLALTAPPTQPAMIAAALGAYPATFLTGLLLRGAPLHLPDLLGTLLTSTLLGALILHRQQAAAQQQREQLIALALRDGTPLLTGARDENSIIEVGVGMLDTLQVAPHLAFIAYRGGTPYTLAARGAFSALLRRPITPAPDSSHGVHADHDVAELTLEHLRPQDRRHALVAPVCGHGELQLGILLLTRSEDRPFTPEEDSVVGAFAHLLGTQLGQQRALADLREANDLTLHALGAALEHRDDDTGGHTSRVVQGSLQLARSLGWDEARVEALRWGAYLHDLGKLAIPDAVLHKNGPLTPQERQVIQTHAAQGHDMLQNLHFLPPGTLDLVRYHHERWDGQGYPAGLSGLDIPETARLFSIVDVYDALTHVRPYKPAWSHGRALREIHAQAGRQFDPVYVEAFMALMIEHDDAQLVH